MPPYSHLLLDLDDTLYPSASGVWEAVRERIQRYIEDRIGVSEDEAQDLRLRYLEQYGTTLTGLSEEHSVDVEEYLYYVHDIPLDQILSPDPALKTMLQRIQLPRIIFTNAYLPHAERVLDRLGVRSEIDRIIDIYALDFYNKPRPEAYSKVLALIEADDPSRIVYVDDRLSNLQPAAELNMITVHVGHLKQTNTHVHIENIHGLTVSLPGLVQSSKSLDHD